jgi:hypothetical protein
MNPLSADGALPRSLQRPLIAHPALRPLAWLLLQGLLLGLGLGSLLWNGVGLAAAAADGPRSAAWPSAVPPSRAAMKASGAPRGQRAAADGRSALDTLADERGPDRRRQPPQPARRLMLVARLPRSACIMKASLAHNPFTGPGARLARYIRNDHPWHGAAAGERPARRRAAAAVSRGHAHHARPVNPFNSTVGLIAKLAPAPVQTVFIDTDSPYLGKGWPLWRLPPLPIVFTVRLGRRFAPRGRRAGLQDELEAYYAAGVHRPAAPAHDR